MPIQERKSKRNRLLRSLKNCFNFLNPFKNIIPVRFRSFISTEFQYDKMDKFIGINNKETFFNDAIRSYIVMDIMERTPTNTSNSSKGIKRLINDGIFVAAYPPHDGEYYDMHDEKSNKSIRRILKIYWSSRVNLLKIQPINIIRHYFGDKIAYYFAWLGEYTFWLLLPALVGIVVIIFGLFTFNKPYNQPFIDACMNDNEYLMCPVCEEILGCTYWQLKSICTELKIAYILDNEVTVAFSIIMSLWAILFIEYWKRKQTALSYKWNSAKVHINERPRPAFAAGTNLTEVNEITGETEPYFPQSKRHTRKLWSTMFIGFMIILIFMELVGVEILKMAVIRYIYTLNDWKDHTVLIANISSSLSHLISNIILGGIYSRIAAKLTEWEMHKTQREHEDSLSFKLFVFHFFNNFVYLFYIAYFKGKFGRPGHYFKFMGLRIEQCGQSGCIIDLAFQMTVIMVGRVAYQMIINRIIPYILAKFHKWKLHGERISCFKIQCHRECELLEFEGTVTNYLEIITQFGFVTIFVASFPLTPIFALINNILEIRNDASRLTTKTKRPVIERSNGIGIWLKLMVIIAHVAVLSNAFLIAFTSEFLPRTLYRLTVSTDWSLNGYLNFSLATTQEKVVTQQCRYKDFRDKNDNLTEFYWKLMALRFTFIFIFEHAIILIQKLIDWLVPDAPASLVMKHHKETAIKINLMSNRKTNSIIET